MALIKKKPVQEDSPAVHNSLAVAYSTQKQISKKKMAAAPMAEGGPVPKEQAKTGSDPKEMAEFHTREAKRYLAMANGGMVAPAEGEGPEEDERPGSVTDAIMRKRRFANGGMVDLNEHSEEHGNFADEDSEEANGKEQYDDSQFTPGSMDNDQHGDDIDKDKHDMIAKIRSTMRSKRGA